MNKPWVMLALILGVIFSMTTTAMGATPVETTVAPTGMALVGDTPGSGDGRIHILPTMPSPSLKNGEKTTIGAVIKAPAGVVSVEARIEREDAPEQVPVATVTLAPVLAQPDAVRADNTVGLWQADWSASGLAETFYRVAITVTDTTGHRYTDRSLRFSDPIAGNNIIGSTNYPNGGMYRVDAAEGASGDNLFTCAIVNAVNGYAWFGTSTSPGRIVKVSLGTGATAPTRVGALTLNTGENTLVSAVMDPAYNQGYFGTDINPGIVVKVNLGAGAAVPTRVGAVSLISGEGMLRSAVIDAGRGYVYFGTNVAGVIGQVVKVNMNGAATPIRVGALTLTTGENELACAVIDTANMLAYFGTNTVPGRVVKVALGTGDALPTRVGAVSLSTNENYLSSAVIAPDAGYAWFGTNTTPGYVVKVSLGGPTAAPTRVGVLALVSGENSLRAAAIDPAKGFAWFGTGTSPGRVVKVRLGTGAALPTRMGAITLPTTPVAENTVRSMAMDALNGYIYCGTNTTVGRAVRVAISQKGFIKGSEFTLPEAGTLSSLHLYSHVADGTVRVALYNKATSALVWQSAEIPNEIQGWIDAPTSALSLTAGQYLLAWQVYTTASVPSYSVGAANQGFVLPAAYANFPTPLTGQTATTDLWSAYITYTAPPAAPTNPGATAIGTDRITWTWTDNSGDNETGFKVYAGPGATAPITVTHTTAANVQLWEQTGLGANTQHAFQVAATNAAGDSAKTTTFTTWTLAATPLAPVISGATPTSLNVAIGAGDGNSAATTYTLFCATTGEWVQADGSLGAVPVWQTAAVWGAKTVTGLANGSRYRFVVRARNGAGIETADGPAASAYTQVILTYTAGSGGSISGTATQYVNYGGSGSAVTPQPNACMTFINWNDGSTASPRTDTNVTANLSVTANFADTTAPVITLIGNASVSVNCGSPYVDAGATAADSCDGNISSSIVVTNPVNTAIPAVYTVIYNVSDGASNAAAPVSRTVTVLDTNAPVITLNGAGVVDIDCGLNYMDAGATALDACEGNLTLNIAVVSTVNTSVPGVYTVIYNVSDGYSNAATEVTRTVNVADAMPPVINRYGAATLNIQCGSTYIDPGAGASDACDGDLTAAVVVGGDTVDTDVLGAYVITYNVSDAASNTAVQVTRTVNVVDTEAPFISLLGANPLALECGSAYLSPGVFAWDACDGLLTADVEMDASQVNPNLIGSYAVTYSVEDALGNTAQTQRTVNVVDTTPPAITISGANPASVSCGAVYTDASATALDVCGGDLTASIIVTNSVNTAVAGAYTVTYDVSDAYANAAVQAVRVVNVTDTLPPVITLVGNATVNVECGGVYTDAGATASDGCDGNLTAAIVTTNPVNMAAPGSYTVRYNVSDASANAAAEVTRTVNVVDALAPILSLIGDPIVNVECGAIYVDAGATAVDVCEGVLTGAIVTTNPVNTAVPGPYTVRYNVSDSATNAAAEVTRTVNVVDTTPPAITVLGNNPATVECGDAYVDAGATAFDICSGNLTGLIAAVNSVNTAATGSYTVTYNVSDAASNAAVPAVRTVNVVDTTPPVITLLGDNPLTLNAGTPYVEAGATAADACDGNLTGAIAIDASSVNTNEVGTYYVTYNVSDGAANPAFEVLRTVYVVDTSQPYVAMVEVEGPWTVLVTFNKPMGLGVLNPVNYMVSGTGKGTLSANPNVVALVSGSTYRLTWSCPALMHGGGDITITVNASVEDNESNPMTAPFARTDAGGGFGLLPIVSLNGTSPMDVQCGSSYSDAGATAVDGCGTNITASIVAVNNVNTAVVGAYTVTYNVSDAAGNATPEMERIVNVVDTTPPVITLNGLASVTVDCGIAYVDQGATAADVCDGNLTASIATTNNVNTDVVGAYTVTYNVSDANSNAAAQVTRTVNVVDTKAPILVILGANPLTLECGNAYVSPGSYAWDLCEGDLTASVVVDAGGVNTGVPGTYSVTYNVSDGASNAAPQVVRTVNVVDTALPIITRLGNATVTVECGATYTDAGATAADLCDGDLTAAIAVANPVNTAVKGAYTVRYNVSDAASNAAVEVTRTVNVVDTTKPVITLVGNATVDIECGDPYVPQGATAADNCDGDLTSAILVTDNVNPAVRAIYTVRYNVFDSSANAAIEVTRTVNVVDTQVPVITRLGADTIDLVCGAVYTDPGATALDLCAGNLTPAIVTTNPVNTALPGTYTVRYNVSDPAANAATEVTRTVNVTDSTPPVITLNGPAVIDVECGLFDAYYDAGATAWDSCDGNLTASILMDAGAVNVDVIGTYTVYFDVSDSVSNAAAQVTRTVNVVDTQNPVILLTGANPLTLECGAAYVSPGAFAWDICDGVLTAQIVVDASGLNTAVPGNYVVAYSVEDGMGNSAQIERSVVVVDAVPPVITMNGVNPASVECGGTYTDAGATALDACEGNMTAAIITVNNVNAAVAGLYLVTYDVSDSTSNAATQAVRMVNVLDTTPPTITMLGTSPVTVECGGTYTDAGATASDVCGGNLSASIVVVNNVNAGVTGSYTVTYNVADASANAATQVVRTVNVVDTTPPVITLLGITPVQVVQGTTYTDAGATALDACLGTIAVNTDNPVNTMVAGFYTVTYTASDGTNAATPVTRTVEVTSAAIPLSVSTLDDILLAEGVDYDWSVIASGGTGTIHYQWQRNDGGTFVDVENGSFGAGAYAGVTTGTLNFAPFTAAMAGVYRVEVSDDLTTIYTREATVTLDAPFIPAAGLFGLAVLAAASALAGARALRRRK